MLPDNDLGWKRRDDAFRVIDRAMRLRQIMEGSRFRSARRATLLIEVGKPVKAFRAAINTQEPDIVLVGKTPQPGDVSSMLRKLVPKRLIVVPDTVRVPKIGSGARSLPAVSAGYG